MVDDQYKLIDKTDTELHDWVIEHKPGSAEYVAGIQESMRRVAVVEELMEKDGAPARKRELCAFCIAIIAIVVVICVIVVTSGY